jgi:hypothetical protein
MFPRETGFYYEFDIKSNLSKFFGFPGSEKALYIYVPDVPRNVSGENRSCLSYYI